MSNDGKWIACLSKSHGLCALACAESSTIAWTCEVSDKQIDLATPSSRRVTFSPSQRHLLVFTDDSFFAFAPAVLNTDLRGRAQTIPFKKLWDEGLQFTGASKEQGAHSDPTQAPQRILLEATSLLLRKIPRAISKREFGLVIQDLMDGETVLDVCFMGDGRSLAIISQESSGLVKIKTGDVSWKDHLRISGFADTEFPSTDHSGDEGFTPATLHFYPIEDREEMVVFSDDCTPSVAFWAPSLPWTIKQLKMQKILCFSQTGDRRRMCLLDIDGICILDLPSREIVDKIAYQVDFTALPDGQNPDSLYRDLMVRSPHLLADDGLSIVLPWASDDRPHTVVTPSMDPAEWNLVLRCRKTDTVRSSAVSRNGKCVASIVQRGAQKPSIAIESLIGKIDACESTHGLSLDSLRL